MTISPTNRPTERPTPTIKLGKLTLTGPWAAFATLMIHALLVSLIVWSRPRLGMLLSAAIWLGFIVFWGVTVRRHGPTEAEETSQSRAAHQNLMNLGLLLLFAPIPGLRWRYVPPNPWLTPAGLAVQVAAALFHVWARAHLGRNWSSAVLIKTDHRLVRSGPYRLVRHPIYTAILGMTAGTAVVSGRVLSLLGFVVIAIAYVRKIRIEERVLGEKFGEEWDSYRRVSRALIPWVF